MTFPKPHCCPLPVLALALLLSSPWVVALDSDREQPVEINAQEAELDFKTGTRILSGSVTIIQGTMKIEAEHIEAHFENDALVSATATGDPVFFRQQPEGKKEYVVGKSQRATLDQRNNTITLIERASLKQGNDLVTGETILYDRTTDKLQIKGGMKSQFSSSTEKKSPAKKTDRGNPKTQKPNSTEPTEQTQQLTYTVSRGDTACRIAKRFSVNCRALIKLNKLGKKAIIRIGQKLVIPATRSQQEPPLVNNSEAGSSTSTPSPQKSSEVSDTGRARLVVQPGSVD